MKTLKKMLVLVIMLTIAAGYANDSGMNVPTKTTITLEFSNVKKGHQYIIKDSRGSVIYSESIKRNGSFSKEFNFTSLEISKDFEIIIKPFKIQSQKVIVLKDKETKLFKPVIRLKDNTLIISQMTLESKPLQVELVYDDEVIHSDELHGGQILKAKYGLSNNEKGTYYLEVVVGETIGAKKINI